MSEEITCFNQDEMDKAWEDLPKSCKKCPHRIGFTSCELQEEEDNECPLEYIKCKECENCCKIIKRDGEEYDYYIFCLYEEELMEADSNACYEFERAKGE